MEILKKYKWILFLGLIIRLVVASFTFHPDVRNNSIVSTIILREHNLNPYDFADNLKNDDPRKKIYSNEKADDLPLVYWINIPVQFIVRPLVDGNIEYQYLSQIENIFGNPALFIYLLIIKIQFILFDILLGVLLIFLVEDALKKKILFFWMFNPVTIWATAAIGQFDVIPTFFLVLSFYFLERKKIQWASLSLGLAAAIKSFSFLIFPFLVFLANSWRERIKLTLIFLIPWIFSVSPYLGSSGFRHNALLAPQLSKILYSKIALSGGEGILIVPAILIILYLVYLRQKRGAADFMKFSLSALLLVLAFTHFHIQWFLWVTPFLAILLIEDSGNYLKWSIGLLGFSLLLMLFLFEPSLQIKLFAPILPLLSNGTGLAEVLGPDRANSLRDMAATIFGGASIFLVFHQISPKINEK
ncbi:DUF2029 domain-containing protein [Candidatus Daviesbacteria bacterium]|nr:DUF2029 domain-containing protein [Candidatus Daviesbacteria bacterium]